MKRRNFLKYSLAGAGALMTGPLSLSSCAHGRGKVPMPSWTWYTAGEKRDDLAHDLKMLKRHGFEGVHLQGEGETLVYAADLAHRLGLKIHNWLVTLMTRDEKVLKEHPDWFVVSREGKSSLEYPPYVNYYKWLCPNREEVAVYLEKKVEEIVSVPALDGLHLDYIRFPDVILPVGLWKKYNLVQDRELPQYDFCYCDVCRSKFAAQHGVDPLELPDPTADGAWRQFRYDSITRLVERLGRVVRRHDKQLSAAVFPTPSIARRLVRQEWDRWPLDAVFPMIYHNFYNEKIDWVEEAVREGEEALKGRFPLYAGIFIPSIAPEVMTAAVRYIAKGEGDGLCLFNYRSMTEKHWKHFLV